MLFRRLTLILACLAFAASAQADVKSARAAMNKGDYAEAEADLRRSLDLDKPNALLGLAEICVVTGRYNDAVKYATDASLAGAPKGEDRKRNNGPKTPLGEGDTPIVEVLRLIRDRTWPIQATTEFEYAVPKGSDRMTEIARCLKYCRDALR